MKKLISLLISLIILITPAVPFSAHAGQSAKAENPFYMRGSEQARLYSDGNISLADSVTVSYNGNAYYTEGRQLYNYARKALDSRKEKLTLYYLSKNSSLNIYQATNTIVQKVFFGSTDDRLAVTSTDGDYLRYAIRSYETLSVTKKTKKKGYYLYKISAEFKFYDTLKQEASVDAAVKAFIDSLDTNGKSDFEIIKAVHDYICSATTYSYTAIDKPYSNLYAFSPYGVLIKGSSVCQGYSACFYRICRELGYKTRLVSSDPQEGCHAWNIVELDGKYYVVDCTWDDNIIDEGLKISKDYYFLTDYRSSRYYDSMIDEHKLDRDLYYTSYFKTNYIDYFAEKPYTFSAESLLTSCSVSLSESSFSYSGQELRPEVTVSNPSGQLAEGVDYTLTYDDNIQPGLASVSINGIGRYQGSTSDRSFVIAPTGSVSISVSNVSDSEIKIKWSPTEEKVTGYELQNYTGGVWKTVGTTASSSYTLKSVKSATSKCLRVVPYVKVFKRVLYGSESNAKICSTKPAAGKITSLIAGKGSITLSWKKLKGTGYQLQYSTDKSFSKAKTVKLSDGKLKKTVKKLKDGKTYYVRIRAYKTYKDENGNKKTVYGKWSSKKSVKTK